MTDVATQYVLQWFSKTFNFNLISALIIFFWKSLFQIKIAIDL